MKRDYYAYYPCFTGVYNAVIPPIKIGRANLVEK